VSCERWADAILEQALGAPASPELESHLRSCDGCRDALQRERRLLGRIDGELSEAVSLTPSPTFLPRVRERVATEAPGRRWWTLPVLLPVAASVVVVIAGLSLMRRPPSRPQIVEAPPLPSPRAAVSVEPVAPSAAATRVAPPRVERRRLERRTEPEVLVPPGEEELTRRFVVALRARRADETGVVAGEPESPNLAIPLLAEIPPIEVKPLTSGTEPKEPIDD